jgi:hypothetical protein
MYEVDQVDLNVCQGLTWNLQFSRRHAPQVKHIFPAPGAGIT